MSSKILKSMFIGLTLAISSIANADLIYSNGTVDLENNGAFFSDKDGSSYEIYDDFSLSSANTLSSIDFWGSFWRTGVFEADLAFGINVYSGDTSIDLGNLIGSSSLNLFSQVDTGEDHNNNGTADIYQFSADLDSVINIGDTANYWVSVFATSGTDSTRFTWQEVSNSGNSIQVTNGSRNINTTLAFDLYSTKRAMDVSAPSTIAIFTLALIGLAARKLKKNI
jgi:hypothetical protein